MIINVKIDMIVDKLVVLGILDLIDGIEIFFFELSVKVEFFK